MTKSVRVIAVADTPSVEATVAAAVVAAATLVVDARAAVAAAATRNPGAGGVFRVQSVRRAPEHVRDRAPLAARNAVSGQRQGNTSQYLLCHLPS